jgi:hypothetical protein
MTTHDDRPRDTSTVRQQTTNTGRLANTSAQPGDVSAIPGVEAPIGGPAQEVAQSDMTAHPTTEDGKKDRARIVPPANQGDSAEVTKRIVGGEPGATVY